MGDWDESYQVSSKGSKAFNTGTTTADSFGDTVARAVEWRYVLDKGSGSNMRTGRIQAVFDEGSGSTPSFFEEHSDDIGTTIGVVSFSVDKSGNSVRLRATSTSDGWTVYFVRTYIGEIT